MALTGCLCEHCLEQQLQKHFVNYAQLCLRQHSKATSVCRPCLVGEQTVKRLSVILWQVRAGATLPAEEGEEKMSVTDLWGATCPRPRGQPGRPGRPQVTRAEQFLICPLQLLSTQKRPELSWTSFTMMARRGRPRTDDFGLDHSITQELYSA